MKYWLTRYGFVYGPAEVQRTITTPNGGSVVFIGSHKTGKGIRVYVSPKGRAVKVCEENARVEALNAWDI